MVVISINYNRKPTPLEAFKMDMTLEILDHNIEKVEGDIIGDNQLQSYVVYSSCKIKDEVVAIIGKIAAGWVFSSDKPTNRLVVGLGMMPRGEVGLIFLGLGTSAKLLTPSLEAAILLMVIGTTFLAPVLLRIVLKDKPPNDGNKIAADVAADPVGLL